MAEAKLGFHRHGPLARRGRNRWA